MAHACRNNVVEQFVDHEVSSTGSRRQRRAWRCRAIARTSRNARCRSGVSSAIQRNIVRYSRSSPARLPSKHAGPNQNLVLRAATFLGQRHRAINDEAVLRFTDSLSVTQRKRRRLGFKHLRLSASPTTTLLSGSGGQFFLAILDSAHKIRRLFRVNATSLAKASVTNEREVPCVQNQIGADASEKKVDLP